MSHEDAPALDPEELAAYIDGRLSGGRKAAVEAQLAANEEDYEIFLESVRTLAAEGLLDGVESTDGGVASEAAAGSASNDSKPEIGVDSGSTPADEREATRPAEEPGKPMPSTKVVRMPTEPAFEPVDLEPVRGTVVSFGQRVTSLGRRALRKAPALGGLAAAILGISFAAQFYGVPRTSEDLSKTVTVEAGALNEDWDDPGWRRFRSGEAPPRGQYTDEEIAFRMGIRGVDLRIAANAMEDEGIEAQNELRQLVRNTAYWASGADLVSELAYDDFASALEGDLSAEAIAEQLDLTDREARADVATDPVMKKRYRLGLWAETGRIAVLAGDTEALGARSFRWYRTSLHRDDPQRDNAKAFVDAIKELAKRQPLSEDDLTAIGEQVNELIRLLAG